MKTFAPENAIGPLMDPDGRAILDTGKLSEPIVNFDDGPVKISAILLQPSVDNELKDSQEAGLGVSHSANCELKPCDISFIYVCELTEIPGKFERGKAEKCGLKPGPKYAQLQCGESVKSDNSDTMVHPSDVMDPPIPGPIVLIVDCPTASHLQCLLCMDSLNRYYADFSGDRSDNVKAVNCVVHLSPSSVTNVPDYQRWMKRFGSCQHIMAGYERKSVQIPILKASARIATRLNYLCPQFFPAPWFGSLHSIDNTSLGSNSGIDNSSLCSNSSIEVPPVIISAQNLLKFNLRPYANQGLDSFSVPCSTNPTEIVDELLAEIPEIKDAAQQVRQLWDHPVKVNGSIKSSQNDSPIVQEPQFDEVELPSCLENISREDMEIILLGTGSSQPSKYRNVSSIYINLFSKGGLLFDCGEGTLGQLKRRFGMNGANDVVRSLRCIWISHIHADHHAGLVRILCLRHDLLKGVPHEPLLVIGTARMGKFMSAYEQLEELDVHFLNCWHITRDSWDAFDRLLNPNMNQSLDNLKKVLQDAGLETLISFPVDHPGGAFGVALTAAQRTNSVGKMIPGWKIVYSGDTRPSPVLVEASRGATVLIHEATFEDGMLNEAITKKHSTTKEAIEAGEAAGVYRMILTHFSQRYPKIPVVDNAQLQNAACIAFDLMSINMADLPLLPKILPYLKLLFSDSAIPMDDSE